MFILKRKKAEQAIKQSYMTAKEISGISQFLQTTLSERTIQFYKMESFFDKVCDGFIEDGSVLLDPKDPSDTCPNAKVFIRGGSCVC